MSRRLLAFALATAALAMTNVSASAGGPLVLQKPNIPAVQVPKNLSASPRETMYRYSDGSTAHAWTRNDGKFGVTLHSNPNDPKNDKIEHFVVDNKTGFVTPGTQYSGK
jgi:hypothetical protein